MYFIYKATSLTRINGSIWEITQNTTDTEVEQ